MIDSIVKILGAFPWPSAMLIFLAGMLVGWFISWIYHEQD